MTNNELTIHNNQTAEESEEQKSEAAISYRWTIVPPDPPITNCAIKNHSATIYKHYMYIFGGFDGQQNHNTLRRLNITTLKWEIISTYGFPPKNRNGHTATLVDNVIYIIGGWLGAGPLAADDVNILNLDTCEWKSLICTGSKPGSCNMHSADLYKNEIFIFRGGDGNNYLNDLHALNVTTNTWRKIPEKGVIPAERANHSSAVLNNTLFVFGGWTGTKRLNDLHCFEFKREIWFEVDVYSEVPSPRAGMTLTTIGKQLVLFGGSGPSSMFYNDILIYDFPSNKWITPNLISMSFCPQKRSGHTAQRYLHNIIIFGGSSGQVYLNDVCILEIDPAPEILVSKQSKNCMDVSKFYNNSLFSDLTFKVGDRTFYAHKLVLSLISDKMGAMIMNGMKESKSNVIEIGDIPPNIFEIVLKFLYTAKLNLGEQELQNLELIVGLLIASDQLLIDEIKIECEHHLSNLLNLKNIGYIESLANKYYADKLLNYCEWFRRKCLKE